MFITPALSPIAQSSPRPFGIRGLFKTGEEAVLSVSFRSPHASSTATALMFSCRVSRLPVPETSMSRGFRARSQMNTICSGVHCFRCMLSVSRPAAGRFGLRVSGEVTQVGDKVIPAAEISLLLASDLSVAPCIVVDVGAAASGLPVRSLPRRRIHIIRIVLPVVHRRRPYTDGFHGSTGCQTRTFSQHNPRPSASACATSASYVIRYSRMAFVSLNIV